MSRRRPSAAQPLQVDFSARPQYGAHLALQGGYGTVVCLPWGRGGGKSRFFRTEAYLLVAAWDGRTRPGAEHPGVRICVLMPSLTQAKKVHGALLIAELEGDGEWAWLGGKINRTELRIDFPGGSWIQYLSQEAAQGSRGIRCDVVFVDEGDDVDPSVIDAIAIPWFSEPHSLGITGVGGTPKRGRYGLLYRTYARALGLELTADGQRFPRHFSFHATSYDFPKWISQAAIEKAKLEVADEIFRREWMCDFDAAQGLVYSEFSYDFHVRPPEPGTIFHTYIGGIDWGFTDPTVLLILGVSGGGADTRIHLLHEVHAHAVTESDVADMVRRLAVQYPYVTWYADPSRPSSIEAVRREAKAKIFPADNSIKDGIATVQNALHVRSLTDPKTGKIVQEFSQLLVSPSCTETIKEFGLYRHKRDPRDTERVIEAIEDKNNHCMDALRYALHTHFGGPDRRVQSGY